jgi:GxxExxY protein
MEKKPLQHEELTRRILEACFEVINELGSGFLESVYQNALMIALQQKGMNVEAQMAMPVTFRGQNVGQYFADLFVDNKVIVELKASDALVPEHVAQVINYLKATNTDVGLLVNFGHQKLEIRRCYRPKIEKNPEHPSKS